MTSRRLLSALRAPLSALIALAPIALSLMVALTSPSVAVAQSEEVVALFQQGLAAYREGRFEEAAELFARGHAIEPVPDLSYNLARALENLGRHEEAAAAYRRFLEERPDSRDRRGIEERIRGLEARSVEARRLAEERHRLEAEQLRLERERQERERRAQLSAEADDLDAWPWVVSGAGAAVMIAGAITGGVAQSTYDRATARDITQEESDALERDASTLATTTNALLIGGGVLLAAGLTWGLVALATRGSGPAARDDAIGFTILPLPGGVVVHGRF